MKYLKKQGIFLIVFTIIAGLIVFSTVKNEPQSMSYSELLTEIQAGNVGSIVLEGEMAKVQLNAAVDENSGVTTYEVVVPPDITSASERFTQALDAQLIQSFSISKPMEIPWWFSAVTTIGLVLLMVIWFGVNQRQQGGMGAIG